MQTITRTRYSSADYQRFIQQLSFIVQYDQINRVSTGEILCPECHSGNLCYLISERHFVSIECSTSGCIHWDGKIEQD